jgi:hypothetical protein
LFVFWGQELTLHPIAREGIILEITTEQCARFSVLAWKSETSQIESLLSDHAGAGLHPQEMAVELWQSGYLPAATVDALLDAMEKEMHRVRHKTPAGEATRHELDQMVIYESCKLLKK